ncbi:tripartite tricarboxylate transporter substrate binding protein [Rhodoplanes sp. TEM]|uniref:Tripartite tricarboxylate transporter substrate binding protein n=1 Tax=Rhodoplanes tepidamans TaxID=200616 RepID=A0ABT5JHN8_RHOTP|nr:MULTISPECIES: tripartite tricarboxylate transporter substrate binding protein [Rhodoplanes]MDC7788886.1 tripartite tricarboxylate transporter substrate binding protein [Rhodoplanes tepidamans]MDC7987505.1 tripartite tricarboxylate transporter substrate binding protein [Rhodoplanes sp. TEM]MDQ0355122.1 tripartite-type tricarboxylate transporter receptor subunit TctC [Rhodoplanes tepidamans]
MIVKSAVRCAFGLVALALSFTAGVAPVSAQDYPQRAVTLVVPFAAGGTTDSIGRLYAHYMGAVLGQSVIIDNRPGAGSTVGATAVARSAPDGYTLLLGAISTHAIALAIYDKVSYDPDKDFIPIAHVASVPNVLVVSPKRVKATTVQQFVEDAKKSGTALNMASSGAGTSIHLSGEMFKVGAKVDMVHVPYRGAGPALNDMIAGNVDLMFDNLPSCLPHIQAGLLRPLAVTSSKRLDSLPNVPTVDETVIPGFEAGSWFVVFAPANTPADVVNRLKAATAKVIENPEFRARTIALGATPQLMTGEELERFLHQERKKWAEVVRISGAKAQ